MHEFGWRLDDWERLGAGTVTGHLLECAGQVTGGYFAEPGKKDVVDLAHLGFPIAEVGEDGATVITKVPGLGGCVTLATCKEQLLYEIHDPASYYTPDVVADFTAVTLTAGRQGSRARAGWPRRTRPECLEGDSRLSRRILEWRGRSYAGGGARRRAQLALEIVAARISEYGHAIEELRCDLIGVDALHGKLGASLGEPYEVRVRVAGRAAVRVGRGVDRKRSGGALHERSCRRRRSDPPHAGRSWR